MVTVGELARFGAVSVRTLHHYDAIGLLSPASVDSVTGYRRYELLQLRWLNRILALKDLGFSLPEVGTFLDEKVEVAELRGMLRLRRAELQAGIVENRARLTRVGLGCARSSTRTPKRRRSRFERCGLLGWPR